ncbi:MAG: hypothetical protein MUE78_04485 [Ilumatobacteraceae bacterium]|jgi:hypothetical protein|nr:hypothetical protein [Ilumatobacteraceae bacterium]
MSWHIDQAVAERYADRRLDGAHSASVEAHLERCDACRATVAGAVDGRDRALLDTIWTDLTAALDVPELGWIERALRRVGVGEASARLVAGTSLTTRSYLAAALMSVVLAVLASRSSYDDAFVTFLALAPLGPVLATAWLFGLRRDPVGELRHAVPISALWLLLVRTAAAVVPAIALTALAVPWSLDRGWLAVAWLLPALALVAAALALSSWLTVEVAAAVAAGLWFAGVLTLRVRLRLDALVGALTGPVQLVSLAVLVGAVVVIVLRREAYEYREV